MRQFPEHVALPASTYALLLLLLLRLCTLQLVVATGKARGPWAPEVLPRLPLLLRSLSKGPLLHCDWCSSAVRQLPDHTALPATKRCCCCCNHVCCS
jgi:hypothetical protein